MQTAGGSSAPGQVVVRDDDVDAEPGGAANGFGRGDAVVDREKNVGSRGARGKQVDDGA